MGSGISLNKKQVIFIVKRELEKEFYKKQNNKDIYCDGYLIYYDFHDEVNYNNLLKKIDNELKKIDNKLKNR